VVGQAPAADTTIRQRLWLSRRALFGHLALVVWLPGCIAATWWQVGIARAGDSLGWIYSVMWPGFAIFGTVLWWHIVHDDPATRARRRQVLTQAAAQAEQERAHRDRVIARAEAEDPELASYNAYLASLSRGGQAKRWSTP